MLFETLSALGAGSRVPSVGESGIARLSDIGVALSFANSVRPRDTPATLPEQAFDVPAIESWGNFLDDLDAVELIGHYTSIRTAGDESRDSRGLCPFCRQGADSLLVDGRDDSYFCTDCLAGGHALDFHAHIEGSRDQKRYREFFLWLSYSGYSRNQLLQPTIRDRE